MPPQSSETTTQRNAMNAGSQSGDSEPAPILLRRGDKKAFDQLYYRYAPRVLGLLLRLTGGDRSEAEDLTQETFLASFTSCTTYAEKGHPLSWLLGIAVRRWRDKQRSLKPAALPLSESLREKHSAVEKQVVDRAMIDAALAHLEPPFQEVLLLIAGQQLTYKEVAGITGEPVGTVKWRFHEATKKMRRQMQNDELAVLAAGTARKESVTVDENKDIRSRDNEPRTGASYIARSGSR